MASFGEAVVEVTLVMNEGSTLEDLEFIANVIKMHPELNFVSKNDATLTVAATVKYTVNVDHSTGNFDAVKVE